MEINKKNWLSHLNNIPNDTNGYKTCTYFMALEGWRRGLKLQFHIQPGIAISQGIKISLSDGKKTHYFRVSRGDKVTKEAIDICRKKQKTYEYLRKNNVPIPDGKDFAANATNEEILAYAKELGFPLVIKPTDGGSGKGVITDINSNNDLIKALKKVREELGYKNIIVERFIKGMDYRVYVVDNKVIGIYKRVPANVIGDGKSTIEQLIDKKNQIRRKNPFIKNRRIKIDTDLRENLEKQNLTLTSIIKKGQRVYLRKQGEYLRERDPVDITDDVPEKIKEIAINAVNSVPGLAHCNVDMLVNEETNKGYVNEINSRPQISNHLFPLEGEARDVPKAIIDYYFPETKNGKRNDKYFFDFEPVYSSYMKSNAAIIEIPSVPFNHNLTRFRIDGDLRKRSYERWFRRKFAALKMYGYMMHLSNGQKSIVVLGTTRSLEKLREDMNNKFLFTLKINKIKELSRNRPIKLSFEVYTGKRRRKNRLQVYKQQNKKLKKELKNVKEKYNMLNKSLPLRIYRKLRQLIKR